MVSRAIYHLLQPVAHREGNGQGPGAEEYGGQLQDGFQLEQVC